MSSPRQTDDPPLPALLSMLAEGEEPADRAAAVRALATRQDDRAFEALTRALERDRSLVVRRAAARALRTARPSSWEYRQRGHLLGEATRALLPALRSADVELGGAAAEALGGIDRDEVATGLFAAMADEGVDDRVRRAAADALMALSRLSKVFAATLDGLRHPDAAVRCFILAAAARYVASYDVLKPWERHGWFTPEKTELRVVVNSETERMVAVLSELVDHPDDDVRQLARATLRIVLETLEAKRTRGVIDEREEDDFRSKPTGASEHHRPTAMEKTLSGMLRETRRSGRTRKLVVEESDLRSRAGRLEPGPDGPPPRYADLTWLADEGNAKLPSGHALRRGAWYRLEVAVRAKPTGAPPEGPRRPMREPRQREDALLHVTVEGDGFEVDEPVDTLVLPPSGNSTKQATFRVRPLEESAGEHPAELRVRVYYRFNLLEEIVARAEVVGRFDDPSRARAAARPPLSFRQQRLDRGYVDLDSVRPRAMHVHVERRDDRFVIHFTFFDQRERKVELAAPTPIELTDLEDALAGVRRLWCEIAMNERFATGVEADEDELVPMLRRLAAAGRGLWVRLFKLESGGAMAKVGRWLAEHPPEPEALVQVSLGRGASAFAFPWALLYDRPLPEATWALPDPDGFWGMRYVIEQQPPALHAPDGPRLEPGALRLEVLQWEHFRNIGLQNALLDELERLSWRHLEVGRPHVTDARTCYERLLAGRAHILYFYAHGYTRRRGSDAKPGPELELLARSFESLPPESPARAAHEAFYRRLKQGWSDPDRSWIELTYGRLYLDELYDRVPALGEAPVVILNLCESAQVSPMLADSFVHFFLDRGARAVIGTECPMTIELAHPFSERLLRSLLAGEPAGAALLEARRHFMARRNPLGLAYTLYGRATAAFDPPVIPARPPQEDSRVEPRRTGLAGG